MLIGGFQPFTLSDYPGRPSAIVFTQGCNFRCPFCHNRHLWPATSSQPATHTSETVLAFMAQRKTRLKGIVVTGGEPTLQTGLPSFLSGIKEMGFSVKLDTNGSHPEVVEELIGALLVDYIAMDIKAPLKKYAPLCGTSVDTTTILQSIKIIHSSGLPHHFRTTVYKPLLSENDLLELKKTILPKEAEYRLQDYRDPDSKD